MQPGHLLQVIQLAADRDLDSVVVGVCRVMGQRAMDRPGHLGTAVWWGVRWVSTSVMNGWRAVRHDLLALS